MWSAAIFVTCFFLPLSFSLTRCNRETEISLHPKQRCSCKTDHLITPRSPQSQHTGLPCCRSWCGLWKPHVCVPRNGLWGEVQGYAGLCHWQCFHSLMYDLSPFECLFVFFHWLKCELSFFVCLRKLIMTRQGKPLPTHSRPWPFMNWTWGWITWSANTAKL